MKGKVTARLAEYRCPCCSGVITREQLVEQQRAARQPKRQPLRNNPPKVTNARSRMWMAMRVQLRFTAQSIAAAATAEVPSCRLYINALCKAGYVRVSHKTSFEVGDFTSFVILKDTGPHAPRLRKDRSSIYDINTKTEVSLAR